MKAFYYIITLFLSVLYVQDAVSQSAPPQRRTPRQQAENKESGLPSLSVRAEAKNQEQTQDVGTVPWLREVYRWIDVTKDDNAALYYPTYPVGDRMNLFTLLFKLMAQDKIKGYKYLEGREVFTDKNLVSFEDILKRFEITYTTQKNGTKTEYIIDDSDIPSGEVLLYLIKEASYFDEATGTFNTSVIAISPTIVQQEDEFSDVIKEPMFWLTYDEIRPYLAQSKIMTSNYNNAMTYTMDDYFRKRMYKGEIVKTTNMMNKSLVQIVGNKKEALKQAQDSIESQLKVFEAQLWLPKDTATVTSSSTKSNKSSKSTTTKSSRSSSSGTKTEKASKPQKTTTEKASSSPTKSVRRR